MSHGLPSEDELVAERAAEVRYERWLLVRQLVIIFVLVALIVTHGLLAHGLFG